MKIELRRGLLRSGVVLVLAGAVYGVLAVTGSSIEAFLRWFDWLSAAPGLSGLAILIVSPLVVLLILYAVHWVYIGFAGDAKAPSNAE